MNVSKPSNKVIKFSLIIGFCVYLGWRLIRGYVQGYIQEDLFIELVIALVAFPIIFYLGGVNPTIFALMKSFIVIVVDYASGRINSEELLHRLEILIKQFVNFWYDIFIRYNKNQNNGHLPEKKLEIKDNE